MFPQLKDELISGTKHLTENMENRGGGILDIELVDMTDKLEDYYQLKASFDTRDAMGANFINSCLEEFALILKEHFAETQHYYGSEKECQVIMSILSNYTPECLVKTEVECDINCLVHAGEIDDPEHFAWKFEKAVRIAQIDPHRATTHNKGIFNGIDAVAWPPETISGPSKQEGTPMPPVTENTGASRMWISPTENSDTASPCHFRWALWEA